MMFRQEKFGLLVFSLLTVIASAVILLSILQGGLISYIKIIALLFPFLMMIALNARPYWHVAYFAFIASEALVVPIYGLEKFTPLLLVFGATSIVVFLDLTMHKWPKIKFDVIDRWVLVLAILVTGRVIYDRPGFVGFGATEGGFMTALTFVAPVWFFFIIRPVMAVADLTRKQLYFVLFIAVVSAINVVFFKEYMTGLFFGRRLAGSPFWLLCAVLLTLLSTSSQERRREFWFYLCCLFFMALGMFSSFRSRIFFFGGEIALIALLAGRFRKTIVILGLAGVVGVAGMVSSGRVPESAARVISLFITEEIQLSSGRNAGGAMGWEDNFRGKLYEHAWDEIKESPLVGKGFNLNVSTAVSMLAVQNKNTQVDFLAMSGSYHNSIVVLAVKVGLPAAIIFFVIGVLIPHRLYRQLKIAPPSDTKTWGISLLAFWVANTLMLLMNGGSREFFAQMIVSGLMASLSLTKKEELAPRRSQLVAQSNRTSPVDGQDVL